MSVQEFTDQNFDAEVLQADQPVLVDFWAPYCMPCRALLPVIEELAAENAGSAKIGKLNIQEHQQTAIKYSVQNIPTLLVVRNGEVLQRWTGMPSKADMQEALDSAKAAS
ncbi:MAG: thioredoxin [Planctomycetales bacterium]|nr:thioredoxin [Planctomycetales bacterium]